MGKEMLEHKQKMQLDFTTDLLDRIQHFQNKAMKELFKVLAQDETIDGFSVKVGNDEVSFTREEIEKVANEK